MIICGFDVLGGLRGKYGDGGHLKTQIKSNIDKESDIDQGSASWKDENSFGEGMNLSTQMV